MGEPWENQVKIPEASSGTYKIEHIYKDAGVPIPRGSIRSSLLGGQWKPPLVFDHKTKWHQLSYDGGVWMTDLPIEQTQIDAILADFHGRVLIGGLGLGYAVNVLAQRETVEAITVVEISPDVIKLVKPYLKDPDGKVDVVEADLFSFLETPRSYDWAFYDIWQSDGEGTFFETVLPLRKLSESWLDFQRLKCWNENVMRGQLLTALITRLHLSRVFGEPKHTEFLPKDNSSSIFWNWAVPFLRACSDGVIKPGSEEYTAAHYAACYGLPHFDSWWNEGVLTGLWPDGLEKES